MPMMRGVFSIFFIHDLYTLADKHIREKGQVYQWDINGLATSYILLVIASHIVFRLSFFEPYNHIAGIVILFFICRTVTKGQIGINIAADDPDGVSNSKLTGANYFWMVMGGLFWLLQIAGIIDMLNK